MIDFLDMDFDPDVVDTMRRLDPSRLLPYSRRWEPELPKSQRLPAAFKGSMGKSMLDNVSTPIARRPGI